MTLPFLVGGARVVIPGVYDTFRVSNSTAQVVPAGRNMLILGESEKGIPGNQLDLRLNFFTDSDSVKSFYGDGPISDAAKQIFTTQPSPVFAGSVQRLYVCKTNQTTRAERDIESPSNYGKIAASEFGEQGNFIKSQIKETTEQLLSKSFDYLPSPASRTFKLSVSGTQSPDLVLSALDISTDDGTSVELVSLLNTVTGISATGGDAKTTLTAATDLSVSFSDDVLTFTKSGGAGNFGTQGQHGDVVVIPQGSGLAGGSDQNAGAYIVESWSTTAISLRQYKHYSAGAESPASAFDVSAITGALSTDLGLYSPVTVTQTASAVNGAGASVEFSDSSGALWASGNFFDNSLEDILSLNSAAIGNASASVPSSGRLQINLSNASWSTNPKAGDEVQIRRGSQLAGAGNANVGLYTVVSSTGTSLLLSNDYAFTTAAVASAPINGSTDMVKWSPGWISTGLAGLKLSSPAERQVWLEASRITDNAQFPTTKVGGQIALEISYNASAATAATLTIDQTRTMTITPTGTGSTITVKTGKYKTLGMLVDFLNTQANVFARVPDNRLRSQNPSSLDMVTSMPILGASDTPAYNGRLKNDYSSFKALLDNNFGLISFAEGTMLLKVGLPTAESVPSFLSGAVIGSTSDADVQDGLDQSLKIDTRMVVPLFSRDAQYDVEDGNTDSGSSYSIDSIHAATKDNAATASSTKFKRERFAVLSFHGEFQDTMQRCSNIGYERCQMAFQDTRTSDSNGDLNWQLPWMLACSISAGRAQAVLGTSMLNKSFAVNAVRHIGNESLYSDTLTQDFDPEDEGQLESAIEAGLLCWKAQQGAGIVLASPDLTTRSGDNDPQGWVYERANVLFTCDEVRETVRSALSPFIGTRQSDTPLSVVKTAGNDSIGVFIGNGSLLSGNVDSIKRVGTGYTAVVHITPVEALEFIALDVVAERATQGA